MQYPKPQRTRKPTPVAAKKPTPTKAEKRPRHPAAGEINWGAASRAAIAILRAIARRDWLSLVSALLDLLEALRPLLPAVHLDAIRESVQKLHVAAKETAALAAAGPPADPSAGGASGS